MHSVSEGPSWEAPHSPAAERRVPVYHLLDISGSMAGAPFGAVNTGLSMFCRDVTENVTVRDSHYAGIMSSSGDGELVAPGLVSIRDFQPPKLRAGSLARSDRTFGCSLFCLRDGRDNGGAAALHGIPTIATTARLSSSFTVRDLCSKGAWRASVLILLSFFPRSASMSRRRSGRVLSARPG